MSAAETPLVDQQIRDTIASRLDRNACVEAGAGTGKTTVLVRRIVELLKVGSATVDQIAVITFTEKAAAELSVRVRQRLEEAAQDATEGTDIERRLSAALRGLHRARIETIHAFASGLLRERPVEASLDPQFEVVDSLGATLDFDVAFDRWLGELLDGADERVARALNRTLQVAHIRELAEALNEQRSVLPLAPIHAAEPDFDGYFEVFRRSIAALDEVAASCDLPEDDEGVAQLPVVRTFIARIEGALDDRSSLERLLARAPEFKNKGAQKHWGANKEECKAQKAAVKALSDANAKIRDELRSQALAEVMPMVADFVEAFAAQRRRDGRLTFDDLLLWARDLVVDNADVCKDFRAQFEAILVDEFQDTDPVQAELVLRLAGSDAGRLVVVGDPKQSIYRFRRADIAIYDQVKRGVLADDLLQISQNFRSSDGILAWANDVFDRLFVEELGRQPANVALGPSGRHVPGDRPPVVVVHGPDPDTEPYESARRPREQEARTLAATLALVHAEGWPIRDPANDEVRPAQWRDIAVLVPWRTDIELFEDAFAEAGVPLRHEGGKTFFRRQEVRELASLLHAIDDPGDRVALVAALRSPVFGCSDDDLLLWVAAGGSWNYLGGWDQVDGPAVVRDGMKLVRELHRARAGLSLPELVRRALEDTGAVEHALTRPDGRGDAANLLKLVDQARDFSASGGGGLRAFTRWLARNSEEDSEETDASVSEETDDVVRLLTIHGAKGLEFPIVALANLSSRGRNTVPPIPNAVEKKLDLRVGTQAKTGWFSTPGYDDAKEAEKELIELERTRLLYVAVTRARDHLIVPMIDKPNQMLGLLAPSLPEAGDFDHGKALGVHILDRSTLVLPPDEPSRVAIEDADDERVDAAAEALARWETEHGDLIATASAELSVVTATSLEKPWRPVAMSAESPDAALILGEGPPLPLGDAVHRVMELISFPDGADLDEVAKAICTEAELDDHVEEVVELANRCLASPVVQRGLRAAQVVREMQFTIERPDGPGFVNGRVDLLFREGNQWTVVDYKTDVVDDKLGLAEAGRRHEAQASAYIEAVRQVTGVTPTVVFVFARSGGEVTVS